jgi:chromosome segregation and condensation protein ScpB
MPPWLGLNASQVILSALFFYSHEPVKLSCIKEILTMKGYSTFFTIINLGQSLWRRNRDESFIG